MTRSGRSGWLDRCSATTNAVSRTAPRIREPRVSVAVQPAVSAREKPKTMRNSPVPGQSIRGGLAGRLLRTYARAPATAIAAKVDEQRVTPGQVLGEHPAEDQAHSAAADGDPTAEPIFRGQP
jgi:hypothetical protein